ncbi:hypothetical protein E2C01_102189 [Portunus trituberculatus]|uniref:Uncharacterized protein n=1 Tax=Portunus trituberculatus TaxID=210409 RepID=A0A5B7KGP5_PORTR|nr:hypothetical protein [Portunus trituberculatus]
MNKRTRHGTEGVKFIQWFLLKVLAVVLCACRLAMVFAVLGVVRALSGVRLACFDASPRPVYSQTSSYLCVPVCCFVLAS